MDPYKLKYPLESSKGTISEVTLRRPKAKDLLAVDQVAQKSGDLASVFTLVSLLSALTKSEVEDLDAEDFGELSEMVTGFLGHRKSGDPTSEG